MSILCNFMTNALAHIFEFYFLLLNNKIVNLCFEFWIFIDCNELFLCLFDNRIGKYKMYKIMYNSTLWKYPWNSSCPIHIIQCFVIIIEMFLIKIYFIVHIVEWNHFDIDLSLNKTLSMHHEHSLFDSKWLLCVRSHQTIYIVMQFGLYTSLEISYGG